MSRAPQQPFFKRVEPHIVSTVIVALLIALGVALRVQRYAEPPYFTFDEHLFVPFAQDYLLGQPDRNNHPPLGKLLLSIGILLFGYNSVGWRFSALCFGLQNIVIAYWLGRAAFQSSRAGWFAAAFVAADGFFLAYSRTGLLDGTLVCFVLWSVLAALCARGWAGALGSALLAGLATSVKWSGIAAVAPSALALLLSRSVDRRAVLAFGLVPCVHLAVWCLGLRLTHQPSDLPSIWALVVALFKEHVALGHTDSPLASPWYSWIAFYHPLVVKLSVHGSGQRYASTLGNPVLALVGGGAVLAVTGLALATGLKSRLRAYWPLCLAPELERPALVLGCGWLASLAPWMIGRGKFTFSYHYLPSYGFSLVLTAGLCAHLEHKRPKIVLSILALALCAALYFAPVWSELPIGTDAANLRLWFLTWRP